MNYFAFFIRETGFVERCLILLKHVGNPRSKSVPHITIRLFDDDDDDTRIGYLRTTEISYLNIVSSGTFNFESASKDKVVYLLCESEELEALDYRPDYPFSGLHITLYEGSDSEYAEFLKKELESINWGVQLKFQEPRSLEEKELGVSVERKPDYSEIASQIFGEGIEQQLFAGDIAPEMRVGLARLVLDKLRTYLDDPNNKIDRVLPEYASDEDLSGFIDEREKTVITPAQLSIPGMDMYSLSRKTDEENMYVTPPEKARDMAICAIEACHDKRRIDFGDSSIGTGALYLALIRVIADYNDLKDTKERIDINSAIGVDIDIRSAKEAHKRFINRKLRIICGDAISDQIDLVSPRNLMIVNPPYDCSEEIPKDYRKCISLIAKEKTGIKISGKAGLYVYHLLIMDKWLADNGVGVWLIPSSFLDTSYGAAVRSYLSTKVQLLRIHEYDEKVIQFNNAFVSSSIVVFRKTTPKVENVVDVSYGSSLSEPSIKKIIPLSVFANNLVNWQKVIMNNGIINQMGTDIGIPFSELFDVKRGVATGANKFFVLKREKAKEIGIPDIAVKPIIPKSRYIETPIIDAFIDGYPVVEPQLVMVDCDIPEDRIRRLYPSFYAYLQKAKEKDQLGHSVIDRRLVRTREPWYKQESREVPLFFLTYMGRKKKDSPPLYFILNKSKAIALNTYTMIYPKKWLGSLLAQDKTLAEKLLHSLNDVESSDLLQNSRLLAGGLMKLEPGDLKKVIFYNLPSIIKEAYSKQTP